MVALLIPSLDREEVLNTIIFCVFCKQDKFKNVDKARRVLHNQGVLFYIVLFLLLFFHSIIDITVNSAAFYWEGKGDLARWQL